MTGADRLARVVGDHARGLRVRTAKEIALPAANPHVAHDDQVRFVFNPFCNEFRAAGIGEVLHRAHGLELQWIARDVMNEEAVDFHDVRLQPHPQVHAGVRGAVVVECELRAGGAQHREHRHEVADVRNRALLGQLDHDSLRLDAGLPQQRERVVTGLGELPQRARAEVEEQFAFAREVRERLDAGARRSPFQRDDATLGTRLGEQRERGLERRARRSSNQPLITENRPVVEIHDGLEDGGQITPGDQILDAGRGESRGRAKGHGSGPKGWTVDLSAAPPIN